jgi:hypothetical protein
MPHMRSRLSSHVSSNLPQMNPLLRNNDKKEDK